MSVCADSGGFAVTNAGFQNGQHMVYIAVILHGLRSTPLALKYSVLDMSSIFSKASASSLANACSSSYSPGRPMRSRMIRPEPAHPDAQKMNTTRKMRTMEPNEDTRPMMTPVKAEDGDDAMMAEDFKSSRRVGAASEVTIQHSLAAKTKTDSEESKGRHGVSAATGAAL